MASVLVTLAAKCTLLLLEFGFLYSTHIITYRKNNHGFLLFLIRRHWSAEKEFDVLLSFVWPCTSSASPPGTDEEGKRSAQIRELA